MLRPQTSAPLLANASNGTSARASPRAGLLVYDIRSVQVYFVFFSVSATQRDFFYFFATVRVFSSTKFVSITAIELETIEGMKASSCWQTGLLPPTPKPDGGGRRVISDKKKTSHSPSTRSVVFCFYERRKTAMTAITSRTLTQPPLWVGIRLACGNSQDHATIRTAHLRQ